MDLICEVDTDYKIGIFQNFPKNFPKLNYTGCIKLSCYVSSFQNRAQQLFIILNQACIHYFQAVQRLALGSFWISIKFSISRKGLKNLFFVGTKKCTANELTPSHRCDFQLERFSDIRAKYGYLFGSLIVSRTRIVSKNVDIFSKFSQFFDVKSIFRSQNVNIGDNFWFYHIAITLAILSREKPHRDVLIVRIYSHFHSTAKNTFSSSETILARSASKRVRFSTVA